MNDLKSQLEKFVELKGEEAKKHSDAVNSFFQKLEIKQDENGVIRFETEKEEKE